MKITNADRAFWNAKKAPAWMQAPPAYRVSKPGGLNAKPSELIDACVNFHMPSGGWETARPLIESGNLLSVLRIVRKRKDSLIPELRRIAAAPSGIPGSSKRRRSYAIRWYRRAMLERVNQELRDFKGEPWEREEFIASVERVLSKDTFEGMSWTRNLQDVGTI